MILPLLIPFPGGRTPREREFTGPTDGRACVAGKSKMEFNMFRTRQLAMTALMAMVLSQPFVHPAYSAPATSDQAVDDAGVSSLQRGDLVRLRSGGPLMTVETVKGNVVDCIWTDPNGQTDEATFPAKVLQKF